MGQTSLMLAACGGRTDVVRLLLEQEASVDAADKVRERWLLPFLPRQPILNARFCVFCARQVRPLQSEDRAFASKLAFYRMPFEREQRGTGLGRNLERDLAHSLILQAGYIGAPHSASQPSLRRREAPHSL